MAKKTYNEDGSITISQVVIGLFDHADSRGDILTKHSYQHSKDQIPVTIEFTDDPNKIIGFIGQVNVNDKQIKVDITLLNGIDVITGYPCMDGIVYKRDGNQIKSFVMTAVSLCATPNVDGAIEPLQKQVDQIQNNRYRPLT